MIRETELRHELKLVIAQHQMPQARSWVRLHPAGFRVVFPPRVVNNLYLDTMQLNSFNANLSGISTRQKLRLRWYGEAWSCAIHPVLELKCKSNLVGNKKLQTLDCILEWQLLYRHILQTVRHHADEKWTPWLNAAISPTLINQYRREYYLSADGSIRATLDYDQKAYGQRSHGRPNLKHSLPGTDFGVIEIKAAPEHGTALQAAMAYFPLPRSRHSKYMNGVAASWL